ncbi:hypothetical protein BH10PSE1_BH10PSE1_24630 [soil metagenome]
MMAFRPTLLERAYALADGGTCATPKQIKEALFKERFSQLEIQTQLHGQTLTSALSKRCRENYRNPGV